MHHQDSPALQGHLRMSPAWVTCLPWASHYSASLPQACEKRTENRCRFNVATCAKVMLKNKRVDHALMQMYLALKCGKLMNQDPGSSGCCLRLTGLVRRFYTTEAAFRKLSTSTSRSWAQVLNSWNGNSSEKDLNSFGPEHFCLCLWCFPVSYAWNPIIHQILLEELISLRDICGIKS